MLCRRGTFSRYVFGCEQIETIEKFSFYLRDMQINNTRQETTGTKKCSNSQQQFSSTHNNSLNDAVKLSICFICFSIHKQNISLYVLAYIRFFFLNHVT